MRRAQRSPPGSFLIAWLVRPVSTAVHRSMAGCPHAFWNATDEPARLLEVITPAGFEGYFLRLGEVLRPGTAPDMGALAAIAADYELDLDPSSIRLAQAHGLRLG